MTLTQVDLSPDFRNARVYWSSPDADEVEGREALAAGLASAAGFLRRRLAANLPVKRVPQLEFRHDPSLALATRTLELIRDSAGPMDPIADPGEVKDDGTQ